MTQDTTCERRPPTRYGQKGKLISVGDEVKVRYVKTDDYCLVKVLTIEGDGMTVQWLEDVGPSAPSKYPLVTCTSLVPKEVTGTTTLRSVELPPASQSVRKGRG